MIRWHFVLWAAGGALLLAALGLAIVFPGLVADPRGDGAAYLICYSILGLLSVMFGSALYRLTETRS